MSIRKGTTIIAGNSSPLDWTGTLQEYNIALENGTIKQNMVCYITDDTLYTDDIRPEIETLNSVKANKDLSNLSEVGEKHFLNKSQITNCITEIPQNIKLELNNGTLTLKAGSEVIVPNGFEDDGVTPKFDYVTVESDKQLEVSDASSTSSGSGWFIFPDGSDVGARCSGVNYSGATAPTLGTDVIYAVWYDTGNNIIKYTNDNGATWLAFNTSLPICVLSRTNGIATSIDQVFNGIGYIGSTIWIDKGIKGLIPNGRNADGSLKNIEIVKNKLQVITYTTDMVNLYFGIHSDSNISLNGIYSYNKIENYTYNGADKVPWLACGKYDVVGGKVTNFSSKQPFRAVDYSDSSTVSGWGMPSNRYIDLTLGASGTTYTAPANGWFQAVLSTTENSGILNFINTSVGNTGPMVIVPANNSSKLIMPVKRGDVIKLEYTSMNTSGFNQLVFIYAEGEI